ncbi:cysteine desulfurase [Candidatus Poribacteria bacterium]|nr:cysteine desulfurase [Candidatus Poribacteria bacterium]MBT7101003.1 cysteine desulfurase [Candidatus Poribacteria bacterium]MBT7805627.1 cysteine desulfurase [Candidatus Poribacteria bacterium]
MAQGAPAPLDVDAIRQEFPILHQDVRGKPLVYLDNAATTQKPQAVIDRLTEYYTTINANVHRGVHMLSQKATDAFESGREAVRAYLNARDDREVIFVRGTSEAINLVAHGYGRNRLEPGDEIIISSMEHHSNIVPWQMVCEETGAKLRVIPMTDSGELLLEEYARLLSPRTKLVSVVHVSNSLGTVNPVREVTAMAHQVGALVMLDGAQAVQHIPVDVQELGCDFFAFSGHKLYGPTGIGVLWGRQEVLEDMAPYQGGGEMIRTVTFEKTTYNELPHRFEAGTPDIAGVVALEAALEWVSSVGLDRIAAHEADLVEYATQSLSFNRRVQLIGEAKERASVVSFVMEAAHPHDIGTILDSEGIAVRTGHHCTQPVMDRLGIAATARASFAVYNTRDEVDALVSGVNKVAEVLG